MKIKMFSQNDEVKLEKLGWIIEGESVSQDGKISNRISQNSTGGWKVQCFENTDEDSANKAITCNVQLRQIRGNHITYQIGYCLDGDGKLCPEWQRLLKITLD